jgi:hypothetical protein
VDQQKEVDCVEIYLPKTIRFLSEPYRFLREKLTNRLGEIVLDGFSIYEADGAFYGEALWEERTLVVRLLLIRSEHRPATAVGARVKDLGREIATTVAVNEEQVWV